MTESIYDPPQGQSEYDPVSDVKRQELQQSFFAAGQTTPDSRAKATLLSQKTGVPPAVVETDPESVRRKALTEATPYDDLIARTPGTAKWLSDPQNSSVAHDDIDSLVGTEEILQKHSALGTIGKALLSGTMQAAESVASIPAAAYGVATGQKPPDWLRNALYLPNLDGSQVNRSAGSEYFATPEQQRSISFDITHGNFSRAGMTLAAQFAANAPNQAAILLAGATGNPELGLVFAGGTSGANAYSQAIDKGANPMAAATNAVINGATEAGFESLGTLGFLKSWENKIAEQHGKDAAGKVVKEFFQSMFHTVAGEANEEFLTSIAQDLSEYYTGVNPDALKGLSQRAIDAGLVGGFSGGLMTAPAGIMAGRARMNRVKNAELTKETYLALGENLKDSKLRQRLPDAQRSFVEALTKDGPVENIYVPVEAMKEYCQSKKLDPEEFMQQAGVLDAYQEAAKTGGDVVIPTATWANKFVGSDHYDGLKEDIKFAPGDLTPRQAEEEKASIEKEMAEADKAASEVKGEDTAFEPFVKQIEGQMVESGVDKEKAGVFAQVLKGVDTLAQRAGIDTSAFLKRFNLSVSDGSKSRVSPLQEQWTKLSVAEKASRFYHDPVSGTFNDRAFSRMTPPEGKPMVGHISVEGTKFVNDKFKHRAGDDLFRYVGQALSAINPSVAKVGGDFLVYVQDQAELNSILEQAQALIPKNIKIGDYVATGEGFDLTGIAGENAHVAAFNHAQVKSLLEEKLARSKRGDKPSKFELTPGAVAAESAIKNPEIVKALSEQYAAMPESEVFKQANYDEKSGMLSYDGWLHTPARAARASVDLNGLKIINDALGHPAGDAMLSTFNRVVIATAYLPEYAGIDLCHKSGDEYLAQHDDGRVLTAFWLDVENKLRDTDVTIKDADGNTLVKRGITFGVGIGVSDDIAESKLSAAKESLASERTADRILAGVYRQGEEGGVQGSGDIGGDNLQRPSGVVSTWNDGAGGSQTDQGNRSEDQGGAGSEGRVLNQPLSKSDLIVHHNLSSEDLLHAQRMGGLAAPSLAITKISDPIDGFGEITMIGDPSLADPKKSKVFGADVYSPRYPEIKYRFSKQRLDKLSEKLKPFNEKIGSRVAVYSDDLDEGPRGLENHGSVMAAFLSEQGIKYPVVKVKGVVDSALTRIKLRDLISKNPELQQNFQEFASKMFRELDPEERIFNGYDVNGNRKYKPHTLDNVVSMLKKNVRAGEGFNYGVGSLRAKFTQQFRSLSQIKEAEGRLVSKEAWEKVKEEVDKEFFELAAKMALFYKHDSNSFGYSDTAINTLGDVATLGMSAALRENQFENVPPEVTEEIAAYLNKLRELPTEYFEAKPTRAVNLSEFKAAVVPKGLSEEALSILKSNGISVATYKKGDLADRKKVIADVSTNSPGVLFQGGDEDPRGRILFGNGKFNIQLLAKMDDSTFVHEMGHFYLEAMKELATGEKAPQGLIEDFATVRSWLGAEDGKKITDAQHEKFADGFMTYLASGEAPTSALRSAFNKFKVWITAVYKNIKNIGVAVSPEIKGVFDRLLATDDEIATASAEMSRTPLFDDARKAGMSDAEARSYVKGREQARMAAEEVLTAKVMKDYNRTKQKWWKEKQEQISAEVDKEINNIPVYQAIEKLQAPGTDAEPPLRLRSAAVPPEMLKKLPKGTTAVNGMNPDVVASVLGYESGARLLADMSTAIKRKTLVNQIVDRRMAEAYPELIATNQFPVEALKAVHNDYTAATLRREMQHLVSNNFPAFGKAAKSVTRRPPTEAAIKAEAAKIVGNKNVKDLRPDLHQLAEIRSAKEAGEAFGKGDLDGAFMAKRRELLNHELFRAATAAKERVSEAIEDFKAINKPDEKLAPKRDMDLVNAARAVLSQYGLSKSDKTASELLEPIKKYDPDTYDTLSNLVSSFTAEKVDYKQVSFNQFSDMADTVEALWTLAKTSRQMQVKGKIVDIQEVQQQLEDRLADITKNPASRAGYNKAVTKWEGTKMFLLGMKSSMRRVESWVDAVDGDLGDKTFRENLWNPITDSTAAYREAKKGVLEKYLKLVAPMTDRINGPSIISEELDYTFTRNELLAALLHTGNESNLSKFLRGRGWGKLREDGSLDTDKWDGFIQRLQASGELNKSDYDFVQGVWDLLEGMKPDAQKAHKRMYGFYFNEITAKELETPFGKYRGGYVPAIADPFLSQDAAIRGEKDTLEHNNNSFMFPTAGRGFTRARVESYAKPLTMDLRMIPSHIDKVMRFTNIEPAVKDAAKIVMDKGFRSTLDKLDPTSGGDMLVPWLQRTATQKIETASQGWGGKGLDQLFREIRRRTGLQIMTANVTNAMQQFTGLSISALKVEPKHLRNAIWTYSRSPHLTAEAASEKSAFMRTRETGGMIEMQNQIEDILVAPNGLDKAVDFAKKHGYVLQSGTQSIVDTITWTGAYEEAVGKGLDEYDAVHSADSAVRETQGTFNAEDISRFETGTPFVRAFTMFYSYFNMMANLLGTEFTKITRDMGLKKGAGRGLYVYTLGFMVPAVLSELVVRSMAGKAPDKDDDEAYLNEAMSVFFTSQFNTATSMIPGVGPMIRAGVNAFNDKWYDDRISTSPAVNTLESAVESPHSVYKAIFDNGNQKKAARDFLTALGMLTSLPLAPLARPVGYLLDVNKGKKQPTGPIDFTRGLVTGK